MDIVINLSPVTLETDRLILRPWHEDDLADFYEYASVEGVGEAAGWRHHGSINESKRILEIFIAEKCIFALELKENNKVIGSLGLHPSWANDEPEYAALLQKEIGYVLSRDYWGRGLATEAVRGVLCYCFSELSLDAVTVGHFTANDRSRRVIEKCGFTLVRYGVYNAKQLNTKIDDMKYILLKENFSCPKT
jgi:Acetyltransferases, including N-acetylases of ribosomal proteins